jgi:C-terminal processing protease CtpA/Prc
MLDNIELQNVSDDELEQLEIQLEIELKRRELERLKVKEHQLRESKRKQSEKQIEHKDEQEVALKDESTAIEDELIKSESSSEDSIDSLTPEEEARVKESLKHTTLELSDEELQEIKERTELEYNGIKASTNMHIKSTILFVVILIVAVIVVKMFSGTQESRLDTVRNADSDEAYVIDATDYLDGVNEE